jgi:hypothetical protein
MMMGGPQQRLLSRLIACQRNGKRLQPGHDQAEFGMNLRFLVCDVTHERLTHSDTMIGIPLLFIAKKGLRLVNEQPEMVRNVTKVLRPARRRPHSPLSKPASLPIY